MTYQLGVDLGTTKTAAAIWDGEQARAVQLGNRSTAVPSVVFLRPDGGLLFGEAAARRADAEPSRAAREFKRRVGDPVPLRLAGTPFSAQQLMALMLNWVIDRVTQLEGAPPAGIVVTCPANWGPYKRERFLTALRGVDLEPARLVPEPVAAAIHFGADRRVAPGQTVAIYDLGGGTFDAAVLRRSEADFEILGSPDGIESLGGMEVDDAVLGQVWASIGGPPEAADPARAAVLRRDVIEVKEQLSDDVSADVVVDLGAGRSTVVIRRSELEELIRPLLGSTVDSLERSVARSGTTTAELSAVVLVGGSSRIPLVNEMLSTRLGRPVILDSQPQLAVALGAALSTSVPVESPAEELAPSAFDELIAEPDQAAVKHAGSSRDPRDLVLLGAGVVALVIGCLSFLYGLTMDGSQGASWGGAFSPIGQSVRLW